VFSCKKETTNILNKPLRNFTITANITGIKDSMLIVLSRLDINSNTRIDSTYISEGTFKVSGKTTNIPEKYEILIFNDSIKRRIASIDLWIKNKNILLSGDLNHNHVKNLKIEGCDLNNIEKKYQDIMLKYDKESTKEFESAVTPEANNDVFLKYIKLIYSSQIRFIYENPNNFVSLTYVFRHKNRISKDSLRLYYNRLDTILQNSQKGKTLKKIISIKKLKIGDNIQDFESKDINGNIVKLSDFKGKIILLDFWASWCAPCHLQNKNEFSYLHNKYKDQGLTIISYSLDIESAEKAWREASKNDNINWVNFTNLKGFNDPITEQYSIHKIPNSFLINQNGVIVKSFIGYEKGSNIIEKEIIKLLN